ncbi:uncharacterized protein LOC110942476 [Helianthus annuus]|uniref:uncharacterized protein LOC110942476 n=1 Tax=Helianthus annuus TaxID=4232 RepID=UPI000B8FEFBC|nr:uncharacterized protein LOC110942476 [Helianthus annuus]
MGVLKEGPWIIRSQPIFLSEWLPSMKLEKKEVTRVQVWVKIHEVPIAAYTEDGLSMITTAIGEPKHLDSYTASMCIDNWGRSSYARALTELSADKELKEELTLAIPELEGEGFIKETMYIEYEWCPIRCSGCCAFGHSDESCPKQLQKPTNIVSQNQDRKLVMPGNRKGKEVPRVDADGFTGVHSRKVARKGDIQINKPKTKYEYGPISVKRTEETKSKPLGDIFTSRNPFEVLNDINTDRGQSSKSASGDLEDSDEEEVIEIFNETDGFLMEGTDNSERNKGASTPSTQVSNG